MRFAPVILVVLGMLGSGPWADGQASQPGGLTRQRLRAQPELIRTIEMEPVTLPGDMLGAPVDAAFSPDGKYLAVGGKFKVIRFFDGETGKFLCRRPDPRPPIGAQRALIWIDNRYVAALGSDHCVWVWDSRKDFRCVKAFRHIIYESLDLDFSPATRLIVAAQNAGMVSVWNFDAEPSGPEAGLTSVGDRTVAPETMAHALQVAKPGQSAIGVHGVSWSPDGKQLACVSQLGLDILDASGKGALLGADDMPNVFWKSKARKGAAIRDMPLVKRLPVPPGDKVLTQTGHRVDWSPDNRYVAAGYGLRKGASPLKKHAETPASIRLYDPRDWSLAREWPAHKVRVYALEFSPDGSVLASGGQREVALWDPATGKKLMSFPLHDDEVTSVRWSADGKRLVTCAGSERHDSPSANNPGGAFDYPGKDQKVRIWQVSD